MDIERRGKRKDAMDMPIRKPSDPLPHIFDSVIHSGFTTSRRSGVRAQDEAARENSKAARLRKENQMSDPFDFSAIT